MPTVTMPRSFSAPPWRTILFVVVGLLAVVLLGLHRGVDTNWDMLNYHLYNGRALLTGTFRGDVAAASIQTYLNPIIDAPLAAFVHLFGASHGVLVSGIVIQCFAYVTLWRLVREYFVTRPGWVVPVAAFAVAATGSAAMSMSYAHFGDWVSAGCLCEALRLLLKVHRSDDVHRNGRRLLAAGAWMGAAIGLKMTCLPFVLGMLLALPLLSIRWREIARLSAAMVAGWMVFAGYWLVWMWMQFRNPLFPYFNGLFHSSSAPLSSFDDTRYGSTGLMSFVRFPIDMWRGSQRYSELVYQDWRVAAVLVLVAVAGIVVWRRHRAFSAPTLAVATILVVGTAIWLVQFGIYRYFIFGELLVSIVIVHCLCVLVSMRAAVLALALAMVLAGTFVEQAPNWGRDKQLVFPQLAASVNDPHPYILLSLDRPIAYLSLSFAGGTHFASLASFERPGVTDSVALYDRGPLHDQLQTFLARGRASGSMYAVLEADQQRLMPPMDAASIEHCVRFLANRRKLQLCRVVQP